MNRKILSLVLALVMVLGTFGTVSAATGNAKVDWLIEEGLVTGDAGGYRLNDPIRRSEVAAMTARALFAESTAALLKPVQGQFTDVPVNHWANGYINYAASLNFVNGYPGGTFRPDNNITYAEIIKIMVMVNGDVPNVTGYTGAYWATPYITKAIEVGIMDGVVIPNSNYNAAATREKVFELVYNTVMLSIQADREVYEVIVTENARVADLEDDELTVVVLKEGNNSPDAELRYEKGDEIEVTIPVTMDPENLLGKVVELTIDKDNNATKAIIDTDYEYYIGPFVAEEDQIMLNTGDEFDIELELKSSNSIEMLYGVYHNDLALDYDEYLDLDSTDDDKYTAEFARVTVNDDVVFFIDAFEFNDIAPVTKVEEDGEEIYYLDDKTDGSEKVFTLDGVFGYQNSMFMVMGLDEVEEDDVIHVYGDLGIVRKDAAYSGEYERVLQASGVYYAEIDNARFQIRNANPKKPVYSMDGVAHFTLIDSLASGYLDELEDTDVTFMIDLNDSLQLISGEIEFDEKVVLIEEVGTRDIKVINKDGSKATYRADSATEFEDELGADLVIGDFKRGDIAYLFYDGSDIDKLVRLTTAIDINADAVAVETYRGDYDIDLDDMDIRVAGGSFDYNSITSIFIVNTQGAAVTRIDGMSMDEVVDMADLDAGLNAFIMSEADFTALDVGNERKTGSDEGLAYIIVFTDFVLADEFVETETFRLAFSFNPNVHDSIVGEDDIEFDVAPFAVIPSLTDGEIVTVTLENDLVIDVDVRIDNTSTEYEVVSVSTSNGTIRIKLGTVETNRFLADDLMVFGDTRVRTGDMISFDVNKDNELEVILVLPE
jgi:hypothetical protein